METIKPSREIVDKESSVVTINSIPVGIEIPHKDAYLISKWLQENISELISAINHIIE